VQSLQESCTTEDTPWNWFQFVVFVMGLFHLKMAVADAIWKIFIHPKQARMDETSLMKQVEQIRPKETSKIATKPGFCRMHQVIQYTGIASQLDILREEISKQRWPINSLVEWANTQPSWNKIWDLGVRATKNYVADSNLSAKQFDSPDQRDEELENTMLKERYFLLYEELTHALNAGDIGQVEECFLPWAFVFKGCGKHKYATQMIKFLYDLYFVYPPCLRQAIQMNILCNPTGKKYHFRPIDWWVEHNNLYIKRVYGGQFSNQTKVRILKETALIEVWKNLRINFEKMHVFNHKTFIQSLPKMKKTFDKLMEYIETRRTHKFVPKRKSCHLILNMMEEGMNQLMADEAGVARKAKKAEDDEWEDIENEAEGEEGDLEA
ncbi:hypothetical protein JAAARDRAFT_131270, partial [Jaapia argillacea MUCL 33604]